MCVTGPTYPRHAEDMSKAAGRDVRQQKRPRWAVILEAEMVEEIPSK